MATLNMRMIFEAFDLGTSLYLKHGAATDPAFKPLGITVAGAVLKVADNALDDASGLALWDTTLANPATWLNFLFWSDLSVSLQMIGDATNYIVTTAANQPFILSSQQMLVTANNTVLAADPTTEAIDKIFLWNSSGAACKYVAYVIL